MHGSRIGRIAVATALLASAAVSGGMPATAAAADRARAPIQCKIINVGTGLAAKNFPGTGTPPVFTPIFFDTEPTEERYERWNIDTQGSGFTIQNVGTEYYVVLHDGQVQAVAGAQSIWEINRYINDTFSIKVPFEELYWTLTQDDLLVLQNFDGSPAQQWRLQNPLSGETCG